MIDDDIYAMVHTIQYRGYDLRQPIKMEIEYRSELDL